MYFDLFDISILMPVNTNCGVSLKIKKNLYLTKVGPSENASLKIFKVFSLFRVTPEIILTVYSCELELQTRAKS